MAFMNCRLHSKELKKEVEINVILPVESKAPERVLYLLHGLAGDASSWMRRTSIERYAAARNIAVIMPDGGRWFYTDAVRGPATLIGTGAGGYVAATAGAKTGAIVGSLLFPGIGTLLGILVGAAGGAVAGNTVGKLVDENVIRNWKCPDCGYIWRM